MPDRSNRLVSLWQELKRRKVNRVITVYAAAAFVILEAVDIIFPRIGLPEWSITLVIGFLTIGFVLVTILSWIYDVTPEGVRVTESLDVAGQKKVEPGPPSTTNFWKIATFISVFIIVGFIVLQFVGFGEKSKADVKSLRSLAVMPFQNMTGDTLYNHWELSLMDILINRLGTSEELSVHPSRTMFDILDYTGHMDYTSVTPSFAQEIGSKVGANTVIYSSLHKAGGNVRITTNLSDTRSTKVYQTYEINGKSEGDFFNMVDSLSSLIKNYLEIKVLEQEVGMGLRDAYTTSSEAYKYYIQGMISVGKMDWTLASEYFGNAVRIDSNFVNAMLWLAVSYVNNGQREKSDQLINTAYKQIDKVPDNIHFLLKFFKSTIDRNPQEAISYLEQYLNYNPYSHLYWSFLGVTYNNIEQYDKAILAYEEVLALCEEWEIEMTELTAGIYFGMGLSYHKVGNHAKEDEIYNTIISAFPDHPLISNIIRQQAVCALSLGDTVKSDKYVNMVMSRVNQMGLSDYTELLTGYLYKDAGLNHIAISHFRNQLDLTQNEPQIFFELARLLIKDEINISEGMELINHAIEKEPNNSDFLLTKGMGLLKQGNLVEAREIINKSWEIRRGYNHEHFKLIQEVEQALARQESEQ